MKTCFGIIAVVLMVGLATTIDASSPIKESNLLTLRIDDDCRIWWNTRRASPDNLPQLLPSDSAVTDSAEYVLDIPATYELFNDFLGPRSRCAVLILSHPISHYICTDNVLAVLDRFEDDFNDLKARQLNKPVDSLTDSERFSLRYGMGHWYDRDNKVMAATHAARGFVDRIESTVAKEHTFEFQLQAGYWSDRKNDMIELMPPRAVAPKVGIPKPVRDEDPIEEHP